MSSKSVGITALIMSRENDLAKSYRASQKSRTIQVSIENVFIDHNHNRCSNCAPTAMKQASILYIKLSFTLLSVLVLIFGHLVVIASLLLLSFSTQLLLLFLIVALAQGDKG